MKKCLLVLALVFIVGCSEQQMQQMDKVADSVQNATEAGEAVLESPGGSLIPTQYQALARLGGAIAMLFVLGWREFRGRQARTAVREIVAGVEVAKDSLDDNAKKALSTALSTKESVTTEAIVKEVK